MMLLHVDAFQIRGPRLGVGYGIGTIATLGTIVAAWEDSVLKFFNGFPGWLTAPT